MQPGQWYFLPQRGYLSSLFLPEPKHIPRDSPPRVVGWQFENVLPLATAYQSIPIVPAFNCWSIMGTDSLQGAQGFQLQMWHLSRYGQRQMLNISMSSLVLASTLQGGGSTMPMFLPETELFLVGDSIRIQVKNLSRTQNDTIWVALWGGDVEVPND